MSSTRVSHLSQVPVQTGLPKSWKNPVRPELFADKQQASLAKAVGLTQFGVNHVVLGPGAASALRHWHEGEDDFIYVLSGELILRDHNGAHRLGAGSIAGFPAGSDNAHHVVNESDAPGAFLVVGSRRSGGDVVHYPDGDLGPTRK